MKKDSAHTGFHHAGAGLGPPEKDELTDLRQNGKDSDD
jgi:hypothetical protein